MIKELVPGRPESVGLLYCSAEPNSQYQVDTVKAALEAAGLYLLSSIPSPIPTTLASVYTTAACDDSDVIYVPTDNTVAANTGIVDNICQPAGDPRRGRRRGHLQGLRRSHPVHQLLRLGLHYRRDGRTRF